MLTKDFNGRHTTLLHPPNLSNQSTTPTENNGSENNSAKVFSTVVGSDSLRSSLLPIVPVRFAVLIQTKCFNPGAA